MCVCVCDCGGVRLLTVRVGACDCQAVLTVVKHRHTHPPSVCLCACPVGVCVLFTCAEHCRWTRFNHLLKPPIRNRQRFSSVLCMRTEGVGGASVGQRGGGEWRGRERGAVLTPSELAIGYSYRGEGRTLYAIASGERERERQRERARINEHRGVFSQH